MTQQDFVRSFQERQREMELQSSRSSRGSCPSVTVGASVGVRGKLRFEPLVEYLSHTQLIAIFRLFIKAVRERKATRGSAMGRLIIAVSAYDLETHAGGVLRLTMDDAWVEINPVDFITIFFDHIGPGDPPYEEIMGVLLPYIHGGTGTVEERARVCLHGLATSTFKNK